MYSIVHRRLSAVLGAVVFDVVAVLFQRVQVGGNVGGSDGGGEMWCMLSVPLLILAS
jgi:hypothetical protein